MKGGRRSKRRGRRGIWIIWCEVVMEAEETGLVGRKEVVAGERREMLVL